MSHKIKILSVLIVFLCAVFAAGADGAGVGAVLKVKGEVRLMRNGLETSLHPRMKIKGGDLILTGKTGEVSVELQGGHVAIIKPGSEFQVDEPGAERNDLTSAMLYSGTVYVHRRPGGKKKRPHYFQVQTLSAVAGVRGTVFGIAVAPDASTLIGVEEGNVVVEMEEGGKIELGMREAVEVGLERKKPPKVVEYLPERDRLEDWLEKRRRAIVRNPLPVAAVLTRNLTFLINTAEKLAPKLFDRIEFVVREAEIAEKNRLRGRMQFYSQHRAEVQKVLPTTIILLRTFVRLDNLIRGRGKMLDWLVREATAPGSSTLPRAVKVLKKHRAKFDAIKERAEKIHAERKKLLRERVPVLKESVKNFR